MGDCLVRSCYLGWVLVFGVLWIPAGIGIAQTMPLFGWGGWESLGGYDGCVFVARKEIIVYRQSYSPFSYLHP
jgi:hypothetical protein